MPDGTGGVTWGIYLMFAVNLLAIIAGIGKGLAILISVRDEIRDLRRDVGMVDPPSGLLGRVDGIRKEVQQHRDTLIEVTSELGLRRPGGRS